MFRTIIGSPINPIPAEYTSKLKRLQNEPDYSLTCLGIALLRSRCDYDGILGKYWILRTVEDCYDNFTAEMITDNKPYLSYYMYSSINGDYKDKEEKLFTMGFKRKNTIEKLISEKSGNTCFVYYHETNNTAAIFIDTRDMRMYHLLISFIPLYFPALFRDKPMQPDEYEVVKALSKPESSIFINKIKEIMKPYTEEFKRIQLGGLIEQMHEVKITAAKENVDTQKRNVDTYYQNYLSAIEVLKQYIITYEGTKICERSQESEKELVDYICSSDYIQNVSVDGNFLCFIMTSLLTNYNEEAWKSFSERGGIYNGEYDQRNHGFTLLDVFKDRSNRKRLLDSIFGEDPVFAVKMCGYYKINMLNSGIHTRSRFNYVNIDQMYNDYVPNPHLQFHGCLGGYEPRISEKINQGDYLTAIEMCHASAGSVNLDEADLTFKPFVGMIMASTGKILHRYDGVDMTPTEALIYLIDKEKENEAD